MLASLAPQFSHIVMLELENSRLIMCSKTKNIKHAAVVMLLAAALSSCSEKPENENEVEDRYKPKIVYTNYEKLYEQPLSVIQECVLGKWKWILTCGGYVGCVKPSNAFIELCYDHVLITYSDARQNTFYHRWIKLYVEEVQQEIYVMLNDSGNGRYFTSIKNDTLEVHFILPFSTQRYVRIRK